MHTLTEEKKNENISTGFRTRVENSSRWYVALRTFVVDTQRNMHLYIILYLVDFKRTKEKCVEQE